MSERIAESRPLPIPFTMIEISLGPLAWIFSVIAEMTLEDANGVAFLGPEKPREPADAHARTFPVTSVTVTTVLL